MTANQPHNDHPILTPAEDRFGVDPFARALAISVRKMEAPQGTVIGLNGPWGSGKSSAVNLVRHHLADAVQADEIAIVDFACWWFRGEDALALAFFRELYAGLGPSLGERFKKVLPKLGSRLLRAGAVVGKVAEAAGAVVSGGIAEKGMEWLSGLIEQGDSVEKLHAELSKALKEQNKRFLIIIDDIDRLSPDEALLIFRLVKSVGRLPNVMYLLVYDRALAEKIVSERYPSEGPHYLEKIVQASFELPDPAPYDVQQQMLALIEAICGAPAEADMVRFMNIFHEGIAPSIRTPRDVARFANSLSVSWPAVAGEVDRADFLALEMFRILRPELYRAIRQSKVELTENPRDTGRSRDNAAQHFKRLFFGESPPDQDRHRDLLIRLFPVLEGVWENRFYSDGSSWVRARRVCSADHFDTYFRFSVGDEVLRSDVLEEFLARANDAEFVKNTLRQAATINRRAGGTKAAVWLEELRVHAARIDDSKIQSLVTSLFEVIDDINVEADQARAFSIGNNELRLHWLLRALTSDRMSLEERSAVVRQACDTAGLGWLSDFTRSAWTDYHPREGQEPAPPDQCYTTEADAQYLRELLKKRIETAAADGTLLAHRDLRFLLHSWVDVTGDDGAAIKSWTANVISADDGVRQLANAFKSYGWSQTFGDVVARRTTNVSPSSIARLTDVDAFRARVESLAASSKSEDLEDFLDAWRRAERGED